MFNKAIKSLKEGVVGHSFSFLFCERHCYVRTLSTDNFTNQMGKNNSYWIEPSVLERSRKIVSTEIPLIGAHKSHQPIIEFHVLLNSDTT